MPRFLPLFVPCCYFTDTDRQAVMPSKDQDIDIAGGKESGSAAGPEAELANAEDDEDGADTGLTTLRKSSGFTLERYSKMFKDEVFFILYPCLDEALRTDDPLAKEAAIMVLGAISDPDGATNAIRPHLSSLVPFLMELFSDTHEVVRATTCWTLSKFSEWIS